MHLVSGKEKAGPFQLS